MRLSLMLVRVLATAGAISMIVPTGEAQASSMNATSLRLTSVTLCVDRHAPAGCYDDIASAITSRPATRTRAGAVPLAIKVASGRYVEVVNISFPLTLIGPNQGRAGSGARVAEAVVQGFNVTNASNVRIDGFTISPGSLNGGTGVLFHGGSAGTVQNNIIRGYDSEGLGFFGTSSLLFQRNLVTAPSSVDSAKDAVFAGGGASDNAKIIDNVFTGASRSVSGNSAADISLSYTSGAGPVITGNTSTGGVTLIAMFNSSGGLISDNTFTGDRSTSESAIYVGGANSQTTVSNNTISGAARGVAVSNDFGYGPNLGTTISGNSVTTSAQGIKVGAGGINSPTAAVVQQNSITGNDVAFNNESGIAVSASSNYWGSAFGPGSISNVTTMPWCTVADCSLKSDNARLTALSLTPGSLSPNFAANTTAYSSSVGAEVTSISATASTNPGASTVVSGASSLAVGSNLVQIAVTSADGSVHLTYAVAITRAAPPAPAPIPTPTPTPTPVPTPTPTPTPEAPLVNKPSTVVTQADRPGTVAVAVAPTTTTPDQPQIPPVRVDVTWSARTFTVPVTVTVTPQQPAAVPEGTRPPPSSAGLAVGSSVVQLVITDKSGAVVTTFDEPMVIRFSASQAGELPAFSADGVTWTPIPLLATPGLPAGQRDGYFRNGDGAIDIYTRHATYFGMVNDLESPSAPAVKARVARRHMTLHWTPATDNVGVIGYLIRHNGRDYRYVVGTSASLPLRAGDYVVRAVDAAGNHSRRSETVTLLRKWGVWHVRTT